MAPQYCDRCRLQYGLREFWQPMFVGVCGYCKRRGYLHDPVRGDCHMKEPHIHTPAHDFDPPRALVPLMRLPTLVCPDCGRPSACGAVHWEWCVQVPEPEREKRSKWP